MSHILTEKDNASKVWREYWAEHIVALPSKNIELTSYQKLIGNLLKKIIKQGDIKTVLSAGCGQDAISLYLQKTFDNQLDITLLDIVPQAIDWNKQNFSQHDLVAKYMVGDIFQMPFADSSFDLVFNTGVMEHFNATDQINITREILRTLKFGGLFITSNPSIQGKIYKWSVKVAKRKNRWPFGYEVPVVSLHFLRHSLPDIADIREFSQDFITQLNFLSYVHPYFRFLTFPWRFLNKSIIIINLFDLLFSSWLGTYLLTSVIHKKKDNFINRN